MFVQNLQATPPQRFDAQVWTRVEIQESADNVIFSPVETQDLDPLDENPEHPQLRKLTTAAATLERGWFRVAFLDVDDNRSPESASVYLPGAGDDGYPALDALLAASDVDALTELEPEQQAALRAAAIVAVEDYCSQAFVQEGTTAEPVTRLIDGTGRDTLWLKRRLVELVALEGGAATVNDVVVSELGDRLSIGQPSDVVGGSWLDRAMLDVDPPASRAFPSGPGRVRVTGVWGWTDEEWVAGKLAGVEAALRFDMEDRALAGASALEPLVRSARTLGLRNLSQGNLTAELGGEPVVSERVRAQLADLRWRGPVAALA